MREGEGGSIALQDNQLCVTSSGAPDGPRDLAPVSIYHAPPIIFEPLDTPEPSCVSSTEWGYVL